MERVMTIYIVPKLWSTLWAANCKKRELLKLNSNIIILLQASVYFWHKNIWPISSFYIEIIHENITVQDKFFKFFGILFKYMLTHHNKQININFDKMGSKQTFKCVKTPNLLISSLMKESCKNTNLLK
jgi:hypothetical protein